MTNQIIELMPAADRKRLKPHLERVTLPNALEIGSPYHTPAYSYFPVSGVATIMAQSPGGAQLDVGMFGSEGMSDPWGHLSGVRSHFHSIMLSDGHGYRVDSQIVSKLVRESAELRLLLGRYAQTLSTQFAYTALAGACGTIEKRLARWLLMVSDRSFGDTVEFTHVTMADQLKVRRQSVTTALHVLDGLGLIRSDRGSLTIKSRERLREFAGQAYGPPEAEYISLFALSGFPQPSSVDLQSQELKPLSRLTISRNC